MITITPEDARRFLELAPEYQRRAGRDPLDDAAPLEDLDKDIPPRLPEDDLDDFEDDDDWDLEDEDDWDDDDLDDDFEDDDCS